MEDLPKELECPITMELLVDPVCVPCCGRTFSRKPLADWVAGSPRCPMCNGDLSQINISTLPKNVAIGYMVDEHFKKAVKAVAPAPALENELNSQPVPSGSHADAWKLKLSKITGYGRTVIGCLEIAPNQNYQNAQAASSSGAQSSSSASSSSAQASAASQFKTLIIPVVDESGSMSGSPTTQVRYSLSRIVDLVFDTPHLLAHIICYSDKSSSFAIDKTRPRQDSMAAVNLVGRGGGTSFASAFSEIIKVCRLYRQNPEITSISILFLTDGEDSSVGKSGRQELVNNLKRSLEVQCDLPTAAMPLTIHSIGFARDHDFDFLNALRLIGSKEGAYRYADPSEDSDSLANKIGSLFKAIAESGSVPIDLISCTNQPTKDAAAHGPSEFKLVHSDGNRFWFDMTNAIHTVAPEVTFKVRDDEIVATAEMAEEENDANICNLWYSHLTDQLSGELLQLNQGRDGANDLDYKLLIELVLRRANAVLARVSPTHSSYERLLRIIETTKTIQAGQSVDARKLNDMKFEGKYGGGSAAPKPAVAAPSAPAPSAIVAPAVRFFDPRAWNTFDMASQFRLRIKENDHPAFKALGEAKNDALPGILASVDPMTINRDGATLLIAAASVGRISAVKILLGKLTSLDDINKRIGRNGPTAADIALLRGYWISFGLIAERGGRPLLMSDMLFRTCLSNRYYNCAGAMRKLKLVEVDLGMVNIAPNSEIATWLSKNGSMKVSFATAINQGMDEAVEEKLLAKAAGTLDADDATFVFSFRNHYAILDKPSDSHIRIIELLIQHKMAKADEIFPVPLAPTVNVGAQNSGNPEEEEEEEEITWPLFVAAQNGHVGLLNAILKFDSTKEHLNRQNKKGTTALWIASCNRHVDVVYKLLSLGADPNICNLKGDGPLIPCCQKGSLNIVEILLESGASLDAFNRNRDNPILICCRTGQAKILKVLLARLSPDARAKILSESAEIDGFDPMHAAVELDKVECVNALHEFGASLESRTADSNPIIAAATPLHLAAFYGRAAAATALLALGADPIAKTGISSSTPLHLAVKQGHASVVRVLLANSAVKSTMGTTLDAENHLAAYYAQSESNAAIYAEFFENRLAQVLRASLYYAQDELKAPVPAIAAASSSNAAPGGALVVGGSMEKRILDLILNHAQSLGAYSFADFLADSSLAGDSPLLTTALLTGRHELARGLLTIGAETRRPDSHGITPEFWSHLLGFQQSPPPAYVQLMLDRVQSVAKQSLQNKSLMALPRLGANQKLLAGSDSAFNIVLKMNDGFKSKIRDRVVEELRGYAGKFSSSSEESLLGFTDKLKTNRKLFPEGENTIDAIIWEAKIHLIQAVAAGKSEKMAPVNLLALFLYTSHPDIFTQVNLTLASWQSSGSGAVAASGKSAPGKGEQQTSQLWKQYVQCLYRSLSLLPNHEDEIYRTVSGQFDPKEYTIGSEISWNAFSVASREWNNLTAWTNESAKSDPKTKRGIIFIIQPKTAKCIDQYSRFPVESEVVILPGTRFQVKNLYVASIIAFGQANIRTSTYLAKENDLAKAAAGETSIIVELVEIAGATAKTASIEELH